MDTSGRVSHDGKTPSPPKTPANDRAATNPRFKPRSRTSNTTSLQNRDASASDEQSLTSFPSLSPSLADSPDSASGRSRIASYTSLDADHASQNAPRNISGSHDGLFSSGPSDGRSALFEDTPKRIRTVPGTLHHQSDRHIQHLITKVGAIPLVKQMAQDLAERDAQVTRIQRRAEDRERLLRKMLRECEVTNMDIEGRLRELEATRAESEAALKASSRDASGVDLGDQMSEALGDVLGGEEDTYDARELHRAPSSSTVDSYRSSRKPSAELSRAQSGRGETSIDGSRKGWKSIFSSENTYGTGNKTARRVSSRTESAQQKLSAIHTASQALPKRKGLDSDLFKPPPLSADSDDNSPFQEQDAVSSNMSRIPSRDSVSVKSSNSVASWALKLISGKPQAQYDTDAATRQHASAAESRKGSESGRRKSNASAKPQGGLAAPHNRQRNTPINSKLSNVGPNGTIKQNAQSEPSRPPGATLLQPNSPPTESTTGLGPMEMNTILPEDVRPPTLASSEAQNDASEFLTDRFGFIYDQRRRIRQDQALVTTSRSSHGSRVETLENHRKSVQYLTVGEDDAVSIDSRTSVDRSNGRPGSPASFDNAGDAQPAKRWSDYLSMSNLSTELLSHTPSVRPITNIITAASTLESEAHAPQIRVSKRGSHVLPGTNPVPSASRIVSEHADIARPSEPGNALLSTPVDTQQDPVKSLLEQLTEVHDTLQREKTTRWDAFLRKVRTERRRNGDTMAGNNERKSKSLAVPEASWMDGEMIGVAGLGNEGKVGRAKWLEFKNLVLGGIPVAYRAKIWAECSGASALRQPGYYDELVATDEDDQVIVQQIQMDIPRTLTDNIFFRKGQGVQKLSEVLLAYARRNPEVGYCQGMNMIAANLLLIMPTAEEAFWMLATMIENLLPEKYYDPTLLTSRADQTVLRQFVTTLLPQLSAHLDALSIELEALTFQWFLSVFTGCLSAEALFRVWDVILCTQDGGTFLFQVALALLKLNEKALIACQNPAEVYAYINQRMTDHALSIDALIKASEGLRKFVRKDDIVRRRAAVVEQELEMTRQREAIRKGKARAVDAVTAAEASLRSGDGSVKEHTPSEPDQAVFARSKSYLGSDDEEEPYLGELEERTPMPIDEEISWRA